MKLVTWNMQGSSASTENKWNTGVYNLMTQLSADVVCLQECGAVPLSANLVAQDPSGWQMYTWGTTRTRKYILFFPWDTHGNRCNLALVSPYQPQTPLTLLPLNPPQWRPVLGAAINGIWCFSLHAISPGGPDAASLIAAVAAAAGGGANWIVAGDYNRAPGTLVVPQTINPPNGVTHPSSNSQYDYAVGTNTTAVTGQVVNTLVLSDHYPVFYQI